MNKRLSKTNNIDLGTWLMEYGQIIKFWDSAVEGNFIDSIVAVKEIARLRKIDDLAVLDDLSFIFKYFDEMLKYINFLTDHFY